MALKQFSLIFAFISFAIISSDVKGELILSSVERNIDLASQVVKITSKLTFENAGSESADSVLIASGKGNTLAHVDASVSFV